MCFGRIIRSVYLRVYYLSNQKARKIGCHRYIQRVFITLSTELNLLDALVCRVVVLPLGPSVE